MANVTEFRVRSWGDSANPFDFEDNSDSWGFPESHRLAMDIRKEFKSVAESARFQVRQTESEFDKVLFGTAEQREAQQKRWDERKKRVKVALAESGYLGSEDDGFIETPSHRMSWEYKGSKMGDPNDADTDKHFFAFKIEKK